MVSLSFKSLESFVNEDNLVGLREFLSSRSVVIDDRDENGASILLHCAAKDKANFCRELLTHGADVNAEDNVCTDCLFFPSFTVFLLHNSYFDKLVSIFFIIIK